MVQHRFKTAVLAVQANIKIKNRFSNKIEDENNPYSNHSETESSSEEEDEEVGKGGPPPQLDRDGRPSIVPSLKKKGRRSPLRRYKGMLFALLSSFIFSVGALLAKKLPQFHPFSLAFWRFQGAFLPVLPILMHKVCVLQVGDKMFDSLWPLNKLKNLSLLSLLLLRSVLSCNSMLLLFYSLKYSGMGDALTIASSTPILVAIFARIFLGEKCGVITVVASVFTFFGVVVMIRPPMLTGESEFNMDNLIGSGLALGCMVLAAISYTVLRYIRRIHYTITTLFFGAWGTLENLTLALLFHVFNIPNSIAEWSLAGSLAACTFFGQVAIVLAMKAEQAGPVALVRTFDVIFGFALQIIFLGKIPDWLSVGGSSIVVLAVVICGFRKYLRGLPIGHPTRARYRYLMM